jgi:hypothetical protein
MKKPYRYSLVEIDEIRQLIRDVDYAKAVLAEDYFGFDKQYPERVELRLRTYLEQGVPLSEFQDQKNEYAPQAEAKRTSRNSNL